MDIDKLILAAAGYLPMYCFGSLMDIDKLILEIAFSSGQNVLVL